MIIAIIIFIHAHLCHNNDPYGQGCNYNCMYSLRNSGYMYRCFCMDDLSTGTAIER